jgi:hypothetical protein
MLEAGNLRAIFTGARSLCVPVLSASALMGRPMLMRILLSKLGLQMVGGLQRAPSSTAGRFRKEALYSIESGNLVQEVESFASSILKADSAPRETYSSRYRLDEISSSTAGRVARRLAPCRAARRRTSQADWSGSGAESPLICASIGHGSQRDVVEMRTRYTIFYHPIIIASASIAIAYSSQFLSNLRTGIQHVREFLCSYGAAII